MSTKEIPKEFTITRSLWLWGENSHSRLQIGDKYCAVGFFAKACEFPEGALERGTLCAVALDWARPELYLLGKRPELRAVYDVNDAIHSPNREEEITRLFKELDIIVTFKD